MFAALVLKFIASPAPAWATGYRIPYGHQSLWLSQTAFFQANAIEKGDFLSLLPFFSGICDSEQRLAR